MKEKNKKILISGLVFLCGLFFGNAAGAQSAPSLEVEFEREPLFEEANFVPGNEVIRWVKIKNSDSEKRRALVKAANFSDPDDLENLAQVLAITISNGSEDLYGGSKGKKYLVDFYGESESGEIYLSDINSGETEKYDFKVILDASVGNEYQGKTTKFDLVVGFEDEEGGSVLGAAIESSEDTFLEKLGKVLGASVETGAPIAIAILASLAGAFMVSSRSRKKSK